MPPQPTITYSIPKGPLAGVVTLRFTVDVTPEIDGANLYVAIDGRRIGWHGTDGVMNFHAEIVYEWDTTRERDGVHRICGVTWWYAVKGGPRLAGPSFDVLVTTANGPDAGPTDPERPAPPAARPHLARDGAILTQYTPGRSVIPRSVFFLDADAVQRAPDLAQAARDAGVNALDQGMYSLVNPEYDAASPELWVRYARNAAAIYDGAIATCRSTGMLLWAGGDNLAYNADCIARATTHRFAPQALALFNGRLRDSGLCVGIEMLDECGRFDHGDLPGYTAIKAALDAAGPHPPAAWPIFSLSPGDTVRAFDPIADYRSLQASPAYWADLPEGFSVIYWRGVLESRFVQDVADLPVKPTVFSNPSVCPTIGALDGNPPERITFQILGALCLGAVGFRAFCLGAFGGPDPRTGQYPEGWAALSAAYRFIAALEPYLLQPAAACPEPGAEFLCARWASDDRALTLIVHATDRPIATPKIGPADCAGPGMVPLLTIRCLGARLTSVPTGPHDPPPFLRPGEALAYLSGRPGAQQLQRVRAKD